MFSSRSVAARYDWSVRTFLETLTGEATLEHLEIQFGVKVTLDAGAGELEAFVAEHLGARLRASNEARSSRNRAISSVRMDTGCRALNRPVEPSPNPPKGV